jgi:hypothetical protein
VWNADQLEMLARLPRDLRQAFIDANCDETDADLLVSIMEDARAGLTQAQAEDRVNEHCNSRRNNATLVASVGFAGGATLGGGDILEVGSEVASKVAAHPAVTAGMDMLAGGITVALLTAGVAGALRLGALRRHRNVLRRCARSLVRGVR